MRYSLVSLAHLIPMFSTDLFFFSSRQFHSSFTEMKVIFQTNMIVPPFTAENYLLHERTIMKLRFGKVIFSKGNNVTPLSFLHE